MNSQSRFRVRVWWLRAGGKGLPPAHIAYVLGTTQAAVESVPLQSKPLKAAVVRSVIGRDDRQCFGLDARKVRRLSELGYQPPEIARLIRISVDKVRDFLGRATAPGGSFLPHPKQRYKGSAWFRDPVWSWRGNPSPESDYQPGPCPVAHDATQESPTIVPVRSQPSPWEGPVTPHSIPGERHGRRRLSWVQAEECRRLHGAGASHYSLARIYGVAPNTIANAVAGKTWSRPPSEESPGLEEVQAVMPKPPRKGRDQCTRWRPAVERSPRDKARRQRGTANGNAVLTPLEVADMRQMRDEGWTYKALSDHFGVSVRTVWLAISGRTWSHIEEPTSDPRSRRLTMKRARRIRELHARGAMVTDLAARYMVSCSEIRAVLRHDRWPE
jgi:lambda repressor-like predicted transcriptional regulator